MVAIMMKSWWGLNNQKCSRVRRVISCTIRTVSFIHYQVDTNKVRIRKGLHKRPSSFFVLCFSTQNICFMYHSYLRRGRGNMPRGQQQIVTSDVVHEPPGEPGLGNSWLSPAQVFAATEQLQTRLCSLGDTGPGSGMGACRWIWGLVWARPGWAGGER